MGGGADKVGIERLNDFDAISLAEPLADWIRAYIPNNSFIFIATRVIGFVGRNWVIPVVLIVQHDGALQRYAN